MVGFARQGQRDEARRVGRAALTAVGDTAPIHSLLGRLACEQGDFADGIAHLRSALDIAPDDIPTRCDLVAALIQTGDLDGAFEACDGPRAQADPSRQLARFRGYVAQQLGNFPEAVLAYRAVIERSPNDAGTWNNLGNALTSTGDEAGGIEALKRAAELDPRAAPTRLNLGQTLSAAGRQEEAIEVLQAMTRDFPDDAKPWTALARIADLMDQSDKALEACEEAAKRDPADPSIQLDLGNQRQQAWDTEGAEQAFRAALALDPRYDDAYVALALLYEHRNLPELIPALVREAEEAGIQPGSLALVRAYAHRRDKEWQAALDSALSVPEDREPARRAQLIGESLDRLGRPDEAFAWFETMNRHVREDRRVPPGHADIYRDMVAYNRSTLTPEWLQSWTPPVPAQQGERGFPIFLLGFPRSGTTLLDTMLMGHPGVRVMEERPAIGHVEHALGGINALPSLGSKQVRAARDDYWREVATYVDLEADSLVIDKSPLYLNKTAIMHRLFPGAKTILALRHPMDVVLSCFITSFRPNPAMANFLDLQRTAELYDSSMAAFEQARGLLDLDVFTISYERMIAERDAELRPLFDWLGLDWQEEVLDHQATAAKRGAITTASYSQVHEPLYSRAAGRWTRYAKQLEPVRDILAPWVEKFGYSLEDPTRLPEREGA